MYLPGEPSHAFSWRVHVRTHVIRTAIPTPLLAVGMPRRAPGWRLYMADPEPEGHWATPRAAGAARVTWCLETRRRLAGGGTRCHGCTRHNGPYGERTRHPPERQRKTTLPTGRRSSTASREAEPRLSVWRTTGGVSLRGSAGAYFSCGTREMLSGHRTAFPS